MKVTELEIAGAWVFEPTTFRDERGYFVAPFQGEPFVEATGFEMPVRQANMSRSAQGVIRGIHFADVPPGQAKYVYCTQGSAFDVVVDIRVGSPTFGRIETVELDATSPRAVFIPEGLGHGFMAMEEDTVVSYLCSTPYNPGAEHGIDPLDPELGIPWPTMSAPVLSAKDASVPSLPEAIDTDLLPRWSDCERWYAERITPVDD